MHGIRVSVEAAVELANQSLPGADDSATAVRRVLVEHDFTPAADADDDAIAGLVSSFEPVGELIRSLPERSLDDVVSSLNSVLHDRSPSPSLSAHDGGPLHIHWTPAVAPLDERFVLDVVMALAQTLCDHGLDRFGRCGADDCDRVFFDATKNRSRRFCTDPRCASRTHTQQHRARARAG